MYPTDHRPRRTVRSTLILALGASVLAVMLAACTVVTRTAGSTPSSPVGSPLPPITGTYDPSSDRVVQVVQHVAPAVVNVTNRTLSPDAFGNLVPGQDVGTGFIVRADGFIVTNFHVVEGSVNIKVTLPPPDGRTFTARVVGGDSAHDVAVLKIDATGLPTVELGDSATLDLGEAVVAIGYPLALPGGPTVTSGIISSLARTVQAQDPNAPGGARTYEDALQTDAAINPGNSGGPLVDLNGLVVGINTAGVGAGQAENIGFSIAINAVKPIIDQAIASPSAPVAYLGVSTQTLTPGLALQLGVGVNEGAYVAAVTPGAPADKAGIRQGDVIVTFDGQAVTGSDQLGTLIQAKKPGDRVRVEVARADGSKETVTVTLGIRPLP